MNRVGSVRSVGTSRSWRSEGTEPSAFERLLPQVAENIEISLPKGLPFALSAQLAGQSKMAKILENGSTTYNVTVEPNGRKINTKELLRMDAMAPAEVLFDDNPMPQVRYNDLVLDAIIDERSDRSSFRKERLRKFATHRYVPALVTERLVPCWRSCGTRQLSETTPAAAAKARLQAAFTAMKELQTGKPAEDNKGRVKKNQRSARKVFVTPTVSVAMKCTTKVELPNRRWIPSGKLDLNETIHPPIMSFESGGFGPMFEEVEKEKFLLAKNSRKLWLAGDVMPAGVAQDCSEEVLEIREQSQVNLRSLRSHYDQRRAHHNKKKSAMNESGSAFERYFRDCKVKDKEAAENRAKAAVVAPVTSKFDLGGLGLGLAKSRQTVSGTDFHAQGHVVPTGDS